MPGHRATRLSSRLGQCRAAALGGVGSSGVPKCSFSPAAQCDSTLAMASLIVPLSSSSAISSSTCSAPLSSRASHLQLSSQSRHAYSKSWCRRRRRTAVTRASLATEWMHVLQAIPPIEHLPPLADTGIGLPCSIQNCGDAIYRSTLDLELRNERGGLTSLGAALLGAVSFYFFAPPGVGLGLLDNLLLEPVATFFRKAYDIEDFKVEREIGRGGFGTVYKGQLLRGKVPGFKKPDPNLVPELASTSSNSKSGFRLNAFFGGNGENKNDNGSDSSFPSTRRQQVGFLQDGGTEDSRSRMVILKRVEEFGDEERWMNERMARAGINQYTPGYLGSYIECARNDMEYVWMAWRYEGAYTLSRYMKRNDFPECLEMGILGKSLDRYPSRSVERRLIVIRELMRQIFECTYSLHCSGIIHRDIKPENLLVSDIDSCIKIIDLGAAADLRVGINYVPNEYLLDPRYAPPEEYVMSSQTPAPPPRAIATLLSPVLWLLNKPDRFDMYSCGITLMQLAFPYLTDDNNLVMFNEQLARADYDLREWRRTITSRNSNRSDKRLQAGFEILDANGGEGWDLACALIKKRKGGRLSAGAAAVHPFIARDAGVFSFFLRILYGFRLSQVVIGDILLESAIGDSDILTEADLLYLDENGSLPSLRRAALAMTNKAIGGLRNSIARQGREKGAGGLQGALKLVKRASWFRRQTKG